MVGCGLIWMSAGVNPSTRLVVAGLRRVDRHANFSTSVPSEGVGGKYYDRCTDIDRKFVRIGNFIRSGDETDRGRRGCEPPK